MYITNLYMAYVYLKKQVQFTNLGESLYITEIHTRYSMYGLAQ